MSGGLATGQLSCIVIAGPVPMPDIMVFAFMAVCKVNIMLPARTHVVGNKSYP